MTAADRVERGRRDHLTALGITPCWTLTHEAKPSTINEARTWHYHTRAKHDAEWSDVFAKLARLAHIPKLDAVEITVRHERPNLRSMPDVGSPMFSVKAAIDGLAYNKKTGIGARIIPHDGPEHVRKLTFLTPEVTGRHALVLELREVP